jgi:alpha-galactosidase
VTDRPSKAPAPPMGWNSWDVYGASVTEEEVLLNATYLATHMLSSGWEYVVVDIQWYEPSATSSSYHPFVPLTMDDFSRLTPAVNRFPSAANGAGFAPLAAKIHALGLKFGIHVMRGIPRQAVHQNTAILGTDVRAREVAATDSTCAWNTDMYGVDPNAPGAQQYYDSLFDLYASWDVDFVKVDDALFPYAAGEIELIRDSIDRCQRDIVLSLSCGPMDMADAPHVRAHAEMWRMSGDFWDTWEDLFGMFEFCDKWTHHGGEGHWPDADMLPLGEVALRSKEHGIGRRWTRLSHDEQRTMITLWCIFRSPLMIGSYLPTLDEWTLALLTNDDVLQVVRSSHGARQLFRRGHLIVWVAARDDTVSYMAVFNTGFTDRCYTVQLGAAGLPETAVVHDLWDHASLGAVTRSLSVDVASHGARLLQITRCP